MSSLFIAGTDTDVGKTRVTAVLAAVAQAQGKSVCVYKPIQTGSPAPEIVSDLEMLNYLLETPVETANSYNMIPPVAPFVATAVMETDPIDLDVIEFRLKALQGQYDVVLVEGLGGVRVPLAEGVELTDLILRLNLPVLLVARPGLGSINHTLLTVEALQQREIEIRGVAISKMPPETDDLAIESLPWVFENFLEVSYLYALPELDDAKLNAEHPVVQAWGEYGLL